MLDLAASIVPAYVGHNAVQRTEIPALITSVHAAIAESLSRTNAPIINVELQRPAVPIKKSVTGDYIICLEDGKKFESLKRHLGAHYYNMTPDEYREKWALPTDYPLVASNYAVARSDLAKKMGLGQQRQHSRLSKSLVQKRRGLRHRRASSLC